MAAIDELSGVVRYNLAAGGVGEALIISRVLYSRREDMHYPHRYRSAITPSGHSVSFSEPAVERGDVWPHPADSPAKASTLARLYHINSGED